MSFQMSIHVRYDVRIRQSTGSVSTPSVKGFGKRPDDALNTSSWIPSSFESICGLVMVNNLQKSWIAI